MSRLLKLLNERESFLRHESCRGVVLGKRFSNFFSFSEFESSSAKGELAKIRRRIIKSANYCFSLRAFRSGKVTEIILAILFIQHTCAATRKQTVCLCRGDLIPQRCSTFFKENLLMSAFTSVARERERSINELGCAIMRSELFSDRRIAERQLARSLAFHRRDNEISPIKRKHGISDTHTGCHIPASAKENLTTRPHRDGSSIQPPLPPYR